MICQREAQSWRRGYDGKEWVKQEEDFGFDWVCEQREMIQIAQECLGEVIEGIGIALQGSTSRKGSK
jgi:hypothetical protein